MTMIDKIRTPNAPGAIGPYSQGVVFNNLVFTSGQIAINPETNTIEAQTIEEQTEQVMKNLKAILEAAGSGLDKILKTICFLADKEDFEVFNSIYEKYITTKPARSCVAAKQLPKNVLVEVEAVAVKE